jgi:hypoxanthine phosphoribosyltransferase
MLLNLYMKVFVTDEIADSGNGVNLFLKSCGQYRQCHAGCAMHAGIEVRDDRAEKYGTR